MANWKRTTVGSIYKGQDGKPDYLKLQGNPLVKKTLIEALTKADEKKGLSLNLESKKSRLQGIDDAVAAGRMKPESAEKARESINKMPDYVRFEISLLQKLDN